MMKNETVTYSPEHTVTDIHLSLKRYSLNMFIKAKCFCMFVLTNRKTSTGVNKALFLKETNNIHQI